MFSVGWFGLMYFVTDMLVIIHCNQNKKSLITLNKRKGNNGCFILFFVTELYL